MSCGVYGTMVPTLISEENIKNYIDIYYSYSRTRNSADVDGVTFKRVDIDDVQNYITGIRSDVNTQEDGIDNILDGLYNLKLPSDIFGERGFYTIYIKPREVPVTILDVSTLQNFPGIRGVVLDIEALPDEIKNDASVNNALVGYRLILRNGNERSKDIRIVTSNNKCQPITSVSTATNARSYSYQYNENSSFTFLTITPSTPLSFKANSTPYIGKATQEAYLVNTLFEPICIELEMVENDADTLANMISGSQLRDLNHGVITTFDDNDNIIMQHELSTLKRTETGTPQYEVREKRRSNIDFSQTITDKIQQ